MVGPYFCPCKKMLGLMTSIDSSCKHLPSTYKHPPSHQTMWIMPLQCLLRMHLPVGPTVHLDWWNGFLASLFAFCLHPYLHICPG